MPQGATSSSLLLSSIELSDSHVYGPQIRAFFGTASHFCEAVVLKLRSVPIGATECNDVEGAQKTLLG